MNCIVQLFVYDFEKCKNQPEFQAKLVRLEETKICLHRNCSDPSIKSMHIFVDTELAMNYYSQVTNSFKEKVTYILHGKQPLYSDLVRYAASKFLEGETVCIMNSDVFFNSQKDQELIRKIIKPKRLISLTRHEFTDDNHTICNEDTCSFTVHGGSSDVFIFQTPVPPEFNYETVSHKQNMFGAEAVFHKAWNDCGYEICNPCDDIKTIHLHRGRVHFEVYTHVQTPENSMMNLKTPLPLV